MLTEPPRREDEVEDANWQEVIRCLNEIFVQYSLMFFPSKEEESDVDEQWIKHRRVAMPFFLNYFNTFPLLTGEQVYERIRSWFNPFADAVAEAIGLTPEKILEVLIWLIDDEVQATVDNLREAFRDAGKEHQRFMSRAKVEGWTLEEMRARASGSDVAEAVLKLTAAGEDVFCFDLRRLESRFSVETAQKFLKVFSSHRGQFPGYFYPTEQNPAELHPIFLLENGKAFLPSAHMLAFAALRRMDALLRESSSRSAYFRHRDNEVHRKAAASFETFLPKEARIYQNVYETPDAHFEHDILISIGDVFLVVEAKASPPREPLRDADKAFERIRDDFRRDSGIQGAFEQASRLRSLLLQGNAILYGRDGSQVLKVPSVPAEVFCICVTGDSYSSLATDLSQLLKKSEDDPYPWAVGVHELETLLSGFVEVGKGADDFLEYLRERITLHGKVFSTDELEYAGIFLQSGVGTLRHYCDQGDIVVLQPDTSNIFDEIYKRKHGIVASDKEIPRPPLRAFDLREVLGPMMAAETESEPEPRNERVGRNDPCPCGSGKKYKRCHGR
jgi:hypothetical protein